MPSTRALNRLTRLLGALPLPAVVCCVFAAAGLGAEAASAVAVAPDGSRIELLLRDGNWLAGRLESLGDGAWTLSQVDGGPVEASRTIPRSSIVACLVGSDSRRSLAFLTQFSVGALVLADGQFLPGTLRTDARPAVWEHRWVGSVPLRTDAISEVRLVANRRAPQRSDADMVLFVNGDTTAGFVESIGDEVVLEPIDSDPTRGDAGENPPDGGQAVRSEPPAQESRTSRRIPIDRVAAVTFATLEQAASSDALMWTVDGSIVRAKSLAYEADSGWRFFLADDMLLGGREPRSIGAAATKPTAILLDRASMIPLVACGAPAHERPAATYRYEKGSQARLEAREEALLGLGSVELDGPLHARFDLPATLRGLEGKIVFSAEIALREPVPADARISVAVRFAGSADETLVLDADNRRKAVRVVGGPSKDAVLEIVVEDGGNGVAGDRIAIHRGCFLLQP